MTNEAISPGYMSKHTTGYTANPFYLRYQRLVIKHAARPVLKAMENCMGVNPNFAFIEDQKQEFVKVRYLACYLLKKHTDLSLNQIALVISGGEEFNYGHCNILHGIRTIEEKISMIGVNGNSRPVCRETFNLVEDIEKLL